MINNVISLLGTDLLKSITFNTSCKTFRNLFSSYLFPGEDHICAVTMEDITFAMQHTSGQTISGSIDFDQYATAVFAELHLNVTPNWHEALNNYFILREVALFGM